ncbi:MAG TPA: alpha/beta hydrolase-fold protein, partial [Anaerolineales bacterium]
ISVTAQSTPSVTFLPTYTSIPTTANPTSTSPTVTKTPIPITPTPTLTACMRAGGRVEVYEFTTSLLPNPLVYRIYLPPCYDEDPERSYPVLYLIHGQTYSDTQWDRLGVPETADRLIAAGEAGPFIVVMPRDRIWLEPTEDNFGLAVVQSLVPWVDENYSTIPDRAHRAIGGLSRGAAWAVHIGIAHWEMFSAVGVHSGFVFQTDIQPIYLWLYNTPQGMTPRIYIDIGDDDRPEMVKGSNWLEDLLVKFDVPHEWHMFVGEHEEAYWQAHVEDYLRWYTLDWEK